MREAGDAGLFACLPVCLFAGFRGWSGCRIRRLVTCSDRGAGGLLRLLITGRDWLGGDLVTSRAGQRGPG